MKSFCASLALLAGMFSCSGGPVSAAPLVCSGPTGLVYVLAASCAESNVGVFPGFTVGNCLVVQSDFSLGGGTCGGGGAVIPTPSATGQLISTTNGSTFSLLNVGATGQVLTVAGGVPAWASPAPGGASLSANQTFTGANTFSNSAGISVGPAGDIDVPTVIKWGSANAGAISLGSDTTKTCAGIPGFSLALVDAGGAALTSSDGGTGVCSNLFVNGVISMTGGHRLINFGATDGSAPTLQLGMAGAPAGACNSGSIYTRSDGTTGASVYNCMTSAWVAAPSP